MTKTFIKVITWCLLLAGMLYSCEMGSLKSQDLSEKDDTVTVTINLSSPDSRTVNYTLPDAALYVLTGSRDGGETQTLGSWSTLSADMSVTIKSGAWSFTLDAYDASSGGDVILEDTIARTISGSDTLTFDLASVKSGTGTVDVTVTWPEGSGVSTVEAMFAGVSVTADLTMGALSAEYTTAAAPAGDSLLTFLLYDSDSGLLASVTELVRVRGNLTSRAVIELSSGELNRTPESPESLTASVAAVTASGTTVFLSWTDSSNNETGFEIYRSDLSVPLATVAAAVTTYSDTTAEQGTAYTYRVSAINDFGTSDPTAADPLVTPCLVTFYLKGGNIDGNGDSPISQEVAAGGNFSMEAPRLTGNSFSGWFTGENGSGTEYDASSAVTANLNLYACWVADSTPPSEVSELTVTQAGAGQITVAWTEPADSDYYYAKISADGSTWETVYAGTTSATLSGLSMDTEHTITVIAYDLADNGSAVTTAPGVTFYDETLRDVHFVDTKEELADMANDLDGYYILCSDISLSSSDWTPVGSSSNPFCGVVDGRGFVISNLKISSTSDNRGLFAYAQSVYLKDIVLTDVSVKSTSNYAAALVAYLSNSGTLKGCTLTGIIGSDSNQGSYHAGLIGEAELSYSGSLLIEDCHVSAAVYGYTETGLLAGRIHSGTAVISRCSAGGTNYGKSYYIGGLVGNFKPNQGVIEYSYASNLTINNASHSGGLLCGEVTGSCSIHDCYTMGSVTGATQIGGLFGYISISGSVSRCYTDCSLSGSSYIGALLGYPRSGISSTCYYNSDTYSTSNYGTALTTAEMTNTDIASTYFSGFDFDTVWASTPAVNGGYPYLKENTPDE